MSTKIITIIFIVGIVVLISVGVTYLFSGKKVSQSNQPVQKAGQVQNKNSVTEVKNQAINPTPIPVSTGTLFVTFDGTAPKQIEVKVGKALIIFNNTNSDAIIKTSGALNKDIVVPAKKTVSTEIFNNSGVIKAWVESNKTNIATITIK